MGILMNFLLFVSLATLIGLSTAWNMVEHGNSFSTQKIGPWVSWINAANPLTDPYTRAHYARSGQLPMSSTSARYFQAVTDNRGRALRTNCEYGVTGKPMDALWWSIAAYDNNGDLFENKSKRYAFNSTNTFLREDGTFLIRVAQKARPGSWLPVHGRRRFRLALRIYRPAQPDYVATDSNGQSLLPEITRIECQ